MALALMVTALLERVIQHDPRPCFWVQQCACSCPTATTLDLVGPHDPTKLQGAVSMVKGRMRAREERGGGGHERRGEGSAMGPSNPADLSHTHRPKSLHAHRCAAN